MVTLVLRFVEPVSERATGASLTQVIVIVPVAVFEAVGPKASLRRNVKVSVPQKSAFGVYIANPVLVGHVVNDPFEGAVRSPE